ncbi:putative diaminopimelate decarboxylase/aspartate kinase [Trichinella spiralis]|uniref:putative diaminopimelate decarboxylase/aspartate kinase n=1 Tax=Trichinella spiralis TaxID=6334 RepID=UPI0001EFBA66|nr:putative diaminopimelate decarboxylase/aspartate kinase [Trichinella spiralis]
MWRRMFKFASFLEDLFRCYSIENIFLDLVSTTTTVTKSFDNFEKLYEIDCLNSDAASAWLPLIFCYCAALSTVFQQMRLSTLGIGTLDVDDAVLAAFFLLAALKITFAAPVDPANH